jgi:hypothetical protein
MNNTELLIGGGKTISGILATALGTAAVEFLLNSGMELTAQEGAGITGAIATLIGVSVKLYKLWRSKK